MGADGAVVFFQGGAVPVFPGAPRRVDQEIALPVAGDGGVARVPGRSRGRVCDRPLVAEDSVEQGRLADVRSPDDGNPDSLSVHIFCRLGVGKEGGDVLHKIVEAGAMLGGEGIEPGDSQTVEFGDQRLVAGAVDLVYGKKNRLFHQPEYPGDLLVPRGEARPPRPPLPVALPPPARRCKRVDLPTFGRPMMAMTGFMEITPHRKMTGSTTRKTHPASRAGEYVPQGSLSLMSGEKYLGSRDVAGTTVHTSLPLPVIFLSDRRRKVHLPFGGRRTSVHGKSIVLDCKGC